MEPKEQRKVDKFIVYAMCAARQALEKREDLIGRRGQVADRLESSVLAMQNMRFDLLRLRSAGVGAVINDLSQATMQARALSRDVDNAIAAASEEIGRAHV